MARGPRARPDLLYKDTLHFNVQPLGTVRWSCYAATITFYVASHLAFSRFKVLLSEPLYAGLITPMFLGCFIY